LHIDTSRVGCPSGHRSQTNHKRPNIRGSNYEEAKSVFKRAKIEVR
jgi:hypothetical protein